MKPSLSDSPQTKSFSSQLSNIVLLAILVGAPIISYIYLQRGIEYRKASLEALQPKDLGPDLTTFIANELDRNGKSKLLRLNNEKAGVEELLTQLDNRIVQKDYFEILEFQTSEIPISEHDMILLDTSHHVRATYQMSKDIGKQIIRDLSVVIPMAPRRKVKLERDDKE